MPLLRGQDVNLGIASEGTRNTYQAPAHYIPARSPNGVQLMLEKTMIQETRPNGVSSQGSTIVQRRAEGDLEFNLYNGSSARIFQSLLGAVNTTTVEAGEVYSHAITLKKNDPLFPTLSLTVLNEGGMQTYGYRGAIVSSVELNTPVDDLVNATASFIAKGEEAVSPPTLSFSTDDYYFPHFDVSIKIADNLAGLSGASAIRVKEYSLSLVNNARINQYLSDQEVIAGLLEMSGSLLVDKENETYHDIFSANEAKAMRIALTRTDVIIGTASNPKVEIDLANVTFENREEDRPIDDIVTENIEFQAHGHASEEPITVTFTNEIATL